MKTTLRMQRFKKLKFKQHNCNRHSRQNSYVWLSYRSLRNHVFENLYFKYFKYNFNFYFETLVK